MSARPSLADSLDHVISALSALRLHVSGAGGTRDIPEDDFEIVSSTGSGATSSVPVVGAAGASSSASAWSREWDLALQAALTADSILALDLSPVQPLEPSSRLTSVREWTPLARLGVALRAGRRDFHILNGSSLGDFPLVNPPVRTKVFVVLRSDRGDPFWTTEPRVFLNGVGDFTGRGNPDSGAVFYSCASKAEASAYLLGAQATWPQRRP